MIILFILAILIISYYAKKSRFHLNADIDQLFKQVNELTVLFNELKKEKENAKWNHKIYGYYSVCADMRIYWFYLFKVK